MHMAYQNDRRAALKRIKLLIYNAKSNIDMFRSKIEEAYACPILPNHVECAEHNYGGVICDVLSPEIYSTRRVMMYIHGGSFIGGSCASWRGFCARLAAKSFSRVVIPEFRLAPAHPYPAAIEDIQAAFRAVYTEVQVACSLDANANNAPSTPQIIIAADSSGASIAMALLFNLRERYRASIAHVILLSPWLDFSANAHLVNGKKKSDELINSETLCRCGEIYTYASNLINPLVSPLKAERELLENFPPLYVQCGEKELLLSDACKLQELLTSCGVSCELDIWPDMMTLFQFADDTLWEPHLAIEKIGRVISETDKTDAGATFENKPRLEHGITADA